MFFISSKKMHRLIQSSLVTLDALQKIIFKICIQRNYIERQMQYERDLYCQSNKMQAHLKALQKLTFPNDSFLKIQRKAALLHLKKIEGRVLELILLRHRIQDFSSFEVCEEELKSLSDNLSLALKQKKHEPLLHSLEQFEDIFNRTLCVVTREPMLFFIFLKMLYQIHEELILWRESETI